MKLVPLFRLTKSALAFVAAGWCAPALAGPPPANCACPLPSDILVFGDADPQYAITTTIDSCDACIDLGGTLLLDADVRVRFGPYDPMITACPPLSDSLVFHVDLQVAAQPAPPGGEAYVVPVDGLKPHYIPVEPDLRTSCVSAFNLDYQIRDLVITGNGGARAFSFDPSKSEAILDLPDNVRSSLGDRMPLGAIRLTQALGIDEPLPPSLRLWPEGLPIRVLPAGGRLMHNVLTVDNGAAYSFVPPQRSNIPLTDVIACGSAFVPAGSCTGSGTVFNGGFFDTPAWVPANVAVDLNGMDMQLDLPAGQEVSYIPLFPQGTWISLLGPAVMTIEESRITTGGFPGGGVVRIEPQYPDCPGYPAQPPERIFTLAVNAAAPEIRADGALLAAIADLNESGPIQWTHNTATLLGCGTFYVPPPTGDLGPAGDRRGPQYEWQASAADFPSFQGRGLYAGVNYNRDRVCTNGSVDAGFCRIDSDCAPGQFCQERWTPFCQNPVPLGGALWTSHVQGHQVIRGIDPAGTSPFERAREMAFYLRRSGVTGVFDAGIDTVSMGNPQGGDFELQFNSFGTAFRGSNSEYADTIMRGTVNVPWPTDTNIPFQGLSICLCGQAKSAGTPDGILVENSLRYWDETFAPYGLDFTPDVATLCPVPNGQACSNTPSPAAKVCVEAFTPVAHFAPDFTSSFGLRPAGQPEELKPLTAPGFEFEPSTVPGLTAYTFQADGFGFSNWVSDGSPDRCEVVDDPDCGPPPTEDFGYIDGRGEIALPYFGLSKSAIQVRRSSPSALTYDVDLHEHHPIDQPGTNPPVPGINVEHDASDKHITVERKIAAGKIAVRYAVDYFRPSWTADPDDGADENGRGLMLGFTRDMPLALGATEVSSGLVLTPGTITGDVGATSAVRLWGLTSGAGRSGLSEIFPPPGGGIDYLSGANTARYDKAVSKLGLAPAALQTSADLTEAMHTTGAAAEMGGHPDFTSAVHTSPLGITADTLTGFVDFSAGSSEQVHKVLVDAGLSTGGEFFAFRRSRLSVERFIEAGQLQAMSTFKRAVIPDLMELPGKQKIAFPGAEAMNWKFDYDVSPSFKFNSIIGNLDLTEGGFSGVAFDKMSATLEFYDDGDWYFSADMKVQFRGHGVEGTTLLGKTKDMTPLKKIDPDVARFLKGLDKFDGAYIRCGAKTRLVDNGCLLRVDIGAQAGGWYLDDAYGGQVSGWLSGKGACLVSVKGKAKLLGGEVGDLYKLEGSFWVAGGIGDCDEGDWDSPGDALDDDWCYACVLKTKVTGHYPPDDLDLSWSKPSKDCD